MTQKDDKNIDNVTDNHANDSLLSLKRCKEWLEHQKLDYETELNSMKKEEQGDHAETNIEELCESILQLQKDLFEVSSIRSVKRYVLERLLSGYVKMKKLFASSVTETVVSEQNQKEFDDQILELQLLHRDILKYEQALAEEQATLKDLQRQRLDGSKVNRDLKEKLEELQHKKRASKTKKDTEAEASLRKHILERQNMIEVARNICQALIFGSAVDWSQDEDLRDLVVSLGQPITLLDT